MDIEELSPRKSAPAAIGQEDLSGLSIGELDERIGRLEAEIARCREAKRAKESTKAAADRLFRM